MRLREHPAVDGGRHGLGEQLVRLVHGRRRQAPAGQRDRCRVAVQQGAIATKRS
jgi:hypothetical protein